MTQSLSLFQEVFGPIALGCPIALERNALLILGAMILDALVGDLPGLFRVLPHPVVLFGRAIHWFDNRLNRDNRSAADRRLRGLITCLILVGGSGAGGLVLTLLVADLPFGWLLPLLLIAILIAGRGLFDHVKAVAVALEDQGLIAGREAVSRIVGRDPNALDEAGVCRAAIESLAENFSDAVVAPIFWTLLFGLPGLLVYKMVNTLDSMVGYRTPRHEAFGWASARLDDLLNLIPARLAGLILCAAALFTPGASLVRALRVMGRDHDHHKSPNSGWPEAAMAGALALALATCLYFLERRSAHVD